MRINTLFYCIWQGIRNIFKNKWFTLASVATISACLFLFGLFYSILTNFQHMVKNAEQGLCVSALLEEGLSDDRVAEIRLRQRRRGLAVSRKNRLAIWNFFLLHPSTQSGKLGGFSCAVHAFHHNQLSHDSAP